MKWSNRSHEFDTIAQEILRSSQKKSFYIWGAGYFGDAIYRSLRDKIDIIGYIDSNEKKWQSEKNMLRVYRPSILNNVERDNVSVLVSAGWTKDIFEQLKNFNFEKNRNCFHIDEFFSILMMYQYGKLCLSVIGISISERCTLKCEKCSTLIPYIKNPRSFSLEDVNTELENLFRVVDYISSLTVNGGDAMCNLECRSIIEFIGKKYLNKQIGTIELCTNAIIIPSEEFLETLRRYHVYFRFTDYGDKARQNINHIIKLLDDWDIKYDHVKFTQWRDMGYPQESNGLFGEEAWRLHFERCDRRSCQLVLDGNFFYCGQVIGADRAGYCPIDEDDYYDLHIPNINKKEFLEFALGYSSKGYVNYCKKCNGGFNVNNKKIPAGIQLQSQEVKM